MTHDHEDNGFSKPFQSARGQRNFLKFSEQKWRDGDGCDVSQQALIAAGVDEFARMWTDKGPIDSTDISDLDEKNAAIPVAEWPKGLDGNPRPPWALYAAAYLVDFATGQKYVFASPAIGASIAIGELKSSVETMRKLRDPRVVPVVKLSIKPMPTRFGEKTRPRFEIVGWKLPGEELLPSAPAPQLTRPDPERMPQAVNVAAETLAGVGDVKPATTSEIINDEIPW